jgi:hypothetical protein
MAFSGTVPALRQSKEAASAGTVPAARTMMQRMDRDGVSRREGAFADL